MKTKGRSPRWRRVSSSIDFEIGADMRGEIGLVDDEQIGAGDAGTALARDFLALADADHIKRQIGEIGREGRGKIVAARFDENDVEIRESVSSFRRWLED